MMVIHRTFRGMHTVNTLRMKNASFSVICMLLLVVFVSGCASTPPPGTKTYAAPELAALEPERASDVVLGAGDTIDITVYRHDELKMSVKIDSSGKFMYPLIGDIDAAGKSIFVLRDEMRKRLSEYVVDPQVIITVSSPVSRKVIVLGEVYSPGVFVLDTDTSFVEAVSKAGGPNHDANLDEVLLLRKNPKEPANPLVAVVPLKKVLGEGDLSQNISLRNGDIVYVPPKKIANVSRFFSHLGQILAPIVNLESGIVLWPQVKDALKGKSSIPLTIPAQ